MISMDSRTLIEISSHVDENNVYTTSHKKVKLSILNHKEEKEMSKIFHSKIQGKKIKLDSLFNFDS